ncbi:serendipity locus protein alpha-like [Toxorhynchites rutilus septentrionalis]|uniref:serendipity locus protein alpha-like n=1 Tax=Toxorhynchites rutilus septentrionalis TaxID=329112 RepID=UPI0024796252|nr:serendipity locus protein alpha-like [Toxorhynchites rutilus septentrionalis]
MIPELQKAIQVAQENLYRGFISSKRSDINWLNDVCGDFSELFNVLHKFLVFESCNNIAVVEMSFLCLSQIVICIRYLEQTLKIEQEMRCVLSSTRQCFLDRIIWCISKIKSVAQDEALVEHEYRTTESSFVSFLDLALNLIGSLTVTFEDGEINQAEQDAEAMLQCTKIRSVVEALITQTFAFGNVLEDNERSRLTAVCQKVLRECIALEKESTLIEGEGSPNAQNRCLRANVLESAIYQLETQVNDCLLGLVYDTFAEMDNNLIGSIREVVVEGNTQEQIDEIIDRFDSVVDQIMQIGLFAISYADNNKAASTIRSCLASVEALDSYLIPSIYVPCNYHTKLLEQHWLEETSSLRYHVQKFIDSNAFALALIEILDSGIDCLKLNFNTTDAQRLIRKSNVFKQHVELNSSELGLEREPLQIYFEDFKMMIMECKAIVKCFIDDATIDSGRILKRFRIMLSKLRKIQHVISSGLMKETVKDPGDHKQSETIAQTDEEKEVNRSVEEFFSNSVQIQSMTSILYRSRRGDRSKRNATAVCFQGQNSFSDTTATQLRKRSETTPEKGRNNRSNKLVKRNSLRVAMFRRQQSKQTEEFFESFKSDMNLQITDILDQLTDLSTTFSTRDQRTIGKLQDTTGLNETSHLNRRCIANDEVKLSNVCTEDTHDMGTKDESFQI